MSGLSAAASWRAWRCYRNAKLGFHFTVLDPDARAGAAALADRVIVGGLYDDVALTELVTACDVTTYDIEHCDTAVLAGLEARGTPCCRRPGCCRPFRTKCCRRNDTLPPGCLWHPSSTRPWPTCHPVIFPWCRRRDTGGYDGRGVVLLRSPQDLSKALPGDTARRDGSYLEACVPYVKELGVIVARGGDGQTVVYPVTEMVFDPELNICTSVIAPAELTPKLPAAPVTCRGRRRGSRAWRRLRR